MPGGEYEDDTGLPLLVMHGDADDLVVDFDREAEARERVTADATDPVLSRVDHE